MTSLGQSSMLKELSLRLLGRPYLSSNKNSTSDSASLEDAPPNQSQSQSQSQNEHQLSIAKKNEALNKETQQSSNLWQKSMRPPSPTEFSMSTATIKDLNTMLSGISPSQVSFTSKFSTDSKSNNSETNEYHDSPMSPIHSLHQPSPVNEASEIQRNSGVSVTSNPPLFSSNPSTYTEETFIKSGYSKTFSAQNSSYQQAELRSSITTQTIERSSTENNDITSTYNATLPFVHQNLGNLRNNSSPHIRSSTTNINVDITVNTTSNINTSSSSETYRNEEFGGSSSIISPEISMASLNSEQIEEIKDWESLGIPKGWAIPIMKLRKVLQDRLLISNTNSTIPTLKSHPIFRIKELTDPQKKWVLFQMIKLLSQNKTTNLQKESQNILETLNSQFSKDTSHKPQIKPQSQLKPPEYQNRIASSQEQNPLNNFPQQKPSSLYFERFKKDFPQFHRRVSHQTQQILINMFTRFDVIPPESQEEVYQSFKTVFITRIKSYIQSSNNQKQQQQLSQISKQGPNFTSVASESLKPSTNNIPTLEINTDPAKLTPTTHTKQKMPLERDELVELTDPKKSRDSILPQSHIVQNYEKHTDNAGTITFESSSVSSISQQKNSKLPPLGVPMRIWPMPSKPSINTKETENNKAALVKPFNKPSSSSLSSSSNPVDHSKRKHPDPIYIVLDESSDESSDVDLLLPLNKRVKPNPSPESSKDALSKPNTQESDKFFSNQNNPNNNNIKPKDTEEFLQQPRRQRIKVNNNNKNDISIENSNISVTNPENTIDNINVDIAKSNIPFEKRTQKQHSNKETEKREILNKTKTEEEKEKEFKTIDKNFVSESGNKSEDKQRKENEKGKKRDDEKSSVYISNEEQIREPSKSINEKLEESGKKLQKIWENIISKYSDPELAESGDVVDLISGNVIEDNGHLRSLPYGRQSVWTEINNAESEEQNAENEENERKRINEQDRGAFAPVVADNLDVPEYVFISSEDENDSDDEGVEAEDEDEDESENESEEIIINENKDDEKMDEVTSAIKMTVQDFFEDDSDYNKSTDDVTESEDRNPPPAVPSNTVRVVGRIKGKSLNTTMESQSKLESYFENSRTSSKQKNQVYNEDSDDIKGSNRRDDKKNNTASSREKPRREESGKNSSDDDDDNDNDDNNNIQTPQVNNATENFKNSTKLITTTTTPKVNLDISQKLRSKIKIQLQNKMDKKKELDEMSILGGISNDPFVKILKSLRKEENEEEEQNETKYTREKRLRRRRKDPIEIKKEVLTDDYDSFNNETIANNDDDEEKEETSFLKLFKGKYTFGSFKNADNINRQVEEINLGSPKLMTVPHSSEWWKNNLIMS